MWFSVSDGIPKWFSVSDEILKWFSVSGEVPSKWFSVSDQVLKLCAWVLNASSQEVLPIMWSMYGAKL